MAKKQETKEQEFERVESDVNFWKPEIGDVLVGEVSGVFRGGYGDQKIVTGTDGEDYVMPNHAMLVSLLQKFEVGNIVKIICTDEKAAKEKGKNPMKVYEVYKGK